MMDKAKMKNKPERIYNVSKTQLSVARHFGGCNFNGAMYQYDAKSDTLIRFDIWLAETAASKKQAKKAAKAERDKWEKFKQSFAGF